MVKRNCAKAMPTFANPLALSGSVGNEGVNNPADIKAVKERLAQLGFTVTNNDKVDPTTTKSILLFQSIINGHVRLRGDGRIDVDGPTHLFLQALNAPRWMEMPKGSKSEGFINHDNIQNDKHDYGASWTVDVIREAAKLYLVEYKSRNPDAALIQTNNLSLPTGGDSPHHATHETGLSCDIRLPKRDGSSGTTIFSSDYDRDAMRAMLEALHRQKEQSIRVIFFNDSSLVALGLCKRLARHDDHAHIDIAAPKPVLI